MNARWRMRRSATDNVALEEDIRPFVLSLLPRVLGTEFTLARHGGVTKNSRN
jgi:hypothetical protein